MMKLTRCPNLHFYDMDKYDDCPHCSAKSAVVKPSAEKSEEKKVQTSTMQKSTTVSQSRQMPGSGMTISFKQAVNHAGFEQTEAAAENQAAEQPVMQENEEKDQPPKTDGTTNLFSKLGDSIFRKQTLQEKKNVQNEEKKITELPPAVKLQDEQEKPELPIMESYTQEEQRPETTPVRELQPSQASPSLAQAVAAAKAKPSADDGKTVAYYQFADAEPVVGWLIGVSGFYFGESFNLKAGHNFIGRSLSMDVVLVEEKSVSREYHANVIFDPKSRRFFIQPGKSSGLTYLNDDLLLVPAELHIYDKIQLGDSTYVFMPFCGRNFTWDDYANEG